MKAIYLGGKYGSATGRYAFVSDKDFVAISLHSWTATKREVTFYAVTRVDGVLVYMHRLITDFQWVAVDHRDHNGLNNTRSNLRDGAEHNQKNIQSYTGVSRFVGVTWSKRNKNYVAQVSVNNTTKYIGAYSTEEEAAIARDDYVRSLPNASYRAYNFPRPGEQYAVRQ